MGDNSKIEWCHASANPVLAEDLATGKLGYHCVKISPECAFCYAEGHNVRRLPARGTGRRYTAANGREVRIVLHQPALDQMLAWRRPRRIFVCSMTDLFGEFVPSAIIQEVLDACDVAARERGHVCQLLTKRAPRMARQVEAWSARHGRPLPWGVWIGVSAGDQRRANERVPHLLRCDAGVRFVSYEPALGEVSFSPWLVERAPRLNWIIPGGESGAGARPLDVAWVKNVAWQCERAGVACFVKQLGAKPCRIERGVRLPIRLRHPKGGDPAEWPEDIPRVRQFPVPPAGETPWSWLRDEARTAA